MNSKSEKQIVKKALSKLDAKEILFLLSEIETNRTEVDEIKSFLKTKNEHSIRTALIEINNEVDQHEVNKVRKEISNFDNSIIMEVVRESFEPYFGHIYSAAEIEWASRNLRIVPPWEKYGKLTKWLIDDLIRLSHSLENGGAIIDGVERQ